MSEIVTVQGWRLKLETGDDVEIERNFCGCCSCEHTKLTVTRNGKEIASIGDDITLSGEDEVYGGIVVDKDDNVLPDYHWICHIIPNDKNGMTVDKMYYIGLCGVVLDHSPSHKHDRMVFPSNLQSIPNEDKDRICSRCLDVYMGKFRGI